MFGLDDTAIVVMGEGLEGKDGKDGFVPGLYLLHKLWYGLVAEIR